MGVLWRAGLVEPARPLRNVRQALAIRRLGPIAGAAVTAAERTPDAIAVIDERGDLTYRELDRSTNAIARAWLKRGVREGATVGVLCRDHRGVVQAMVATGKIGGRLVLLNTGFARPQLADVASREGIDILVHDEEFADLLGAVDPSVIRYLAWADQPADGATTLDRLSADADGSPLPQPARQGGLVLLTGGTTGTPKGAPRRIQSPLAAAQFLEKIPQRRGRAVYVAAPMFHGTGLSQFIIALALGSTVVLRRRFDALGTLQGIAQHRADMLVLVPTMLRRILALGDDVLAEHDTSSLRIIMSAGAALPADLGNEATRAFGPVVHNLYGCTEVALATIATPRDWAAAPGTVGRPPRGVTVRLYDADDKVITEPGVSGRIFVGNGLRFEGYSGGGSKPVVDGLMGTGDTGHWDVGGRLFVDGRDDDMIVSGGENVFPAEIESVVSAHPDVADVATLPVDDPEFGQRLRMFVVRTSGSAITEDDVKEHVRANLARFKVPREVAFVDAIPYLPTGKVARRELAELRVPQPRKAQPKGVLTPLREGEER